jgi:hypothetical protein
MPDKSVAEKLWIKAGFTVCLFHPTENYEAVLGKLPEEDWSALRLKIVR